MPIYIYIAPETESARRPRMRLDDFLRCWRRAGSVEHCLQQWRLVDLLSPMRFAGSGVPRVPRTTAAIIVRRGGSRYPAPPARLQPGSRLEHRDQISVDISSLPGSLGPSGGKDYAFVPGYVSDTASGRYEVIAARYLARRPNTHRLSVHSLADFVDALCASEEIDEPIRHLMMVTHFAGTMDLLGVRLVLPPGEPTPESAGSIRYTDLEPVLLPTTDPERRLGERLQVRPGLLSPRPTDAYYRERYFHIRGCSLGRMPGFMRGIKRVLGGQLQVTAPKYLHYFSHLAGAGTFEWMAYEFALLRPAAFDSGTVPERLAQARAAFRANADIDRTFRYQDGATIPAAKWDNWIPTRPPGAGSDLDVNAPSPASGGLMEARWDLMIQTPIPGAPAQTLEARFWHFVNTSCYVQVTGLSADPGDGASDPAAARIATLRTFCEGHDDFAVDHEFPVYKRWGYQTLDDFIAGWTWTFMWAPGGGEGGGNLLIAHGTRHEYVVIQPVLDRSVGTPTIFVNYYPDGGGPGAVEQMRADNPNFFVTV